MTKLGNISYLRFGSKIRQDFAGGITSLTPPLSLSPLWISWAENEDAREGAEFYIWGGSLPPGRGRQAPAKGLRTNKFFLFTYKSLPPPAGR